MLSREDVLGMIKESIDDVNAEGGSKTRIRFSEDVVLFGVGSPLDSLDFVNFLAGVEERLEMATGTTLNLTDVMFDDEAGRPFRSVAALAEYVSARTADESKDD